MATMANKSVLTLRILSMRRMLVIYFLLSLVAIFLFLSFNNIGSLGLTICINYIAIIVFCIGNILFDITFAVKAIKDNSKAKYTSYIFISANLISLLDSLIILNPFMSGSTIENLIIKNFLYIALVQFIMSIGFLYALSYIEKKYKAAWWVALFMHGISCLGALFIYSTGNYEIYLIPFFVCGVLGLILLAELFCTEIKKTIPNQ